MASGRAASPARAKSWRRKVDPPIRLFQNCQHSLSILSPKSLEFLSLSPHLRFFPFCFFRKASLRTIHRHPSQSSA